MERTQDSECVAVSGGQIRLRSQAYWADYATYVDSGGYVRAVPVIAARLTYCEDGVVLA